MFNGSSWRLLRRRESDEAYLSRPAEGTIAMKTTVEVTTGPVLSYIGSDTSVVEIDDNKVCDVTSSPR